MAQSTCPACKGLQFEYREAEVPEIANATEIPRVPLAVNFIQCTGCGTVVGVLDKQRAPHP